MIQKTIILFLFFLVLVLFFFKHFEIKQLKYFALTTLRVQGCSVQAGDGPG